MPSQLPPASRSSPATTSARSGQCRPGGRDGRSASSSRLAARISGHAVPGCLDRTNVHIACANLSLAGLPAAGPLYWHVRDRKHPRCQERAAMTGFDDRQRQEEARFKHQQELQFKARNRGNRLFGLWVAEQLGLSGEAADNYAKDVVVADFDSPGDDDIFTKVRADLQAKSVEISDHVLQKRLQEFRQIALEQIKTE